MTADARGVALPDFSCPIAPALHPAVGAIEGHTVAWVEAHGLISGPDALRRFRAGKYGHLAARIHPAAHPDAVNLMADWGAWLFLFDDHGDGEGWLRSPEEIRSVTQRYLRILGSPFDAGVAGGVPLDQALADLARRLVQAGDSGWWARFLDSCRRYLDAIVWEVENRAADITPTIDDYLRRRDDTGAVLTCFVLAEAVEDIFLPDEVRGHPEVRRLTAMANKLVCWQNDVLSGAKEFEQGEIHNFVYLLTYHRGCSRQEAIDVVARQHDEVMNEFLTVAANPPTFAGDAGERLARYLEMLRHWVRANLDWSLETGRYTRYGTGES